MIINTCRFVAAAALLHVSACRPSQPIPDASASSPDTSASITALDTSVRGINCTDVKVVESLDKDILTQQAIHVSAQLGQLYAMDNEVHDCQRIIVQGSGLGPLVTLWLFEAAKALKFDDGVTIAGIAANNGRYPQLGLNQDRSCLVLKGTEASTTDWAAWVVPADSTPGQGTCAGAETVTAKGVPLSVTRLDEDPPDGSNDTSKNPLSIRLLEDGTNYFVGVRCLAKWCIIGNDYDESKRRGPKHAWGDEQRFHRLDSNGRLIATTLRVRISPAANLDAITLAEYDNDYQRVATIHIEPQSGTPEERAAYVEKWGLSTSTLPNAVQLWMRHTGTDPESGWWIRYGQGQPKNAIWLKGTAGRHGALGTVRWRWSEMDEGVWVQCPNGCCGDGSPGLRATQT